MRIGLLGGSFNPPHEGHRSISLAALKRLGLDRIWWVVTPGNPIKSHSELASLDVRMHLAAAVSNHPRIVVTGFEANRPTARTADTLAYLKRRFAETDFVWIMGADNLANFHRWNRSDEILASMAVATIDRPGWRLYGFASVTAIKYRAYFVPEQRAATLASLATPAWTFLTVPLAGHSSTELRKRAARHSAVPAESVNTGHSRHRNDPAWQHDT